MNNEMQREGLYGIVTGALFDFLGWVSCREETLILGRNHDAAPAAQVIREWLKKERKVPESITVHVLDWKKRIEEWTDDSVEKMLIHLDEENNGPFSEPNSDNV